MWFCAMSALLSIQADINKNRIGGVLTVWMILTLILQLHVLVHAETGREAVHCGLVQFCEKEWGDKERYIR